MWQISDGWYWGVTAAFFIITIAGMIRRRDWETWHCWWTKWKGRKR